MRMTHQREHDGPIVDCNGEPITYGTLLRFPERITGEPTTFGVVVGISDYDVTDGDYGQPVGVPVEITVRFQNGSEDSFRTDYRFDEQFHADDLEVAHHGPWLGGVC